ncbi:hypothetical protein GIB67_035212 [Kingdonia uniflora]|uniref:PPM-type phosphatase domain-containing protein n=1 Tax=Kingdonia uniflora TaxID=39325 RepID=A0A7J7KXP0_9MAGN|nr:hypothetical protein GIB67_035212 [Kingdonia uniflora]
MGNSTSRVVECFVPVGGNGKGGVDLDFLEPLDEGLGHSFCYVRPEILDSPTITPSNSERFTIDSSTIDSETLSGSFRRDIIEDRSSKSFPETTFKSISGASVSANVSTARTGNQNVLFSSDTEPSASFESTSSFAAIPLQPLPRGSGPLNGFMSGPLERGYASGPLDRGSGGFMSGPIEKGVYMSGPLDSSTDKSNFSAPLSYSRKKPGLSRLVRSVSGPMKSALTRTFSRHSMSGPGWMQRFFLHPVTQIAWRPKESSLRSEAPRNCLEEGPSEGEYRNTHNLQWAQGKAGEDRVHVVLSEEQGWLFVGIYDGFSGPDAPEFLMSHLYRAIDKELEGLIWDYDDKPVNNPLKSEDREGKEVISGCLEEPPHLTAVIAQSSRSKIVKEKEVKEKDGSQAGKDSITNKEASSDPVANLAGQGRKSKRLYELLQMEHWITQGSASLSQDETLQSRDLLPEAQLMSESVNPKGDASCLQFECPNTICDDGSAVGIENKQGNVAHVSISEQKQSTRRSLIGLKIRNIYRKQKSLRKKLFPWSYDWHREHTRAEERIVEPLGPMRRCKSGRVDHDNVLNAMARALKTTEDAYMDMVEKALERNPELALMGSCVLVMLMKDQDVYVMNLGDSRVILAQERLNDRYLNTNLLKDDARALNRCKEPVGRMELDRISEESPMHNQNSRVNKTNKNQEISICRLKMRAVQLSSDHCTDIEEEVLRIKAEHSDDNQAILNDRVKGQLKVTRAFGAGFLKKAICNEALLEMFRVDYIGDAAYISCTPHLLHHRLCSSDRFLVLSSDGLYQYFSNEEVVSHVAWFIENVPEGDPAQYLIAELLFRAAKKNGMDFHELLDIPNGDRRKYHDDVSVMVVSLEGRIWKSSG